MHSSLVTTTLVHCVLTARCQRSIQLDMLDCYDVSVQPQTRPRSSLTFVWRYTPFVAYTPKPHGHNLCATITLLVLSYCPYVFCVDCSYLWATGHASYCLDHVYRRDERGGERSSRFYRPLTRCARYANYVYISQFYRPLTRCASLTKRDEECCGTQSFANAITRDALGWRYSDLPFQDQPEYDIDDCLTLSSSAALCHQTLLCILC